MREFMTQDEKSMGATFQNTLHYENPTTVLTHLDDQRRSLNYTLQNLNAAMSGDQSSSKYDNMVRSFN